MDYIGTWKDKILDYEIETKIKVAIIGGKSLISWKDKILDYEIETEQFVLLRNNA